MEQTITDGIRMRYDNWPERLNKMILISRELPFEWGKHDCCLFAAHVVKALTGEDFTIPFIGKYATAKGAARLLKKHGGVRGIATAALGEEINPLAAQRGDIVMIDGEHGDTLGVCIGRQCVAPGFTDLIYFPMTAAVTAWRVK